jgi:hypothetical protein
MATLTYDNKKTNPDEKALHYLVMTVFLALITHIQNFLVAATYETKN